MSSNLDKDSKLYLAFNSDDPRWNARDNLSKILLYAAY